MRTLVVVYSLTGTTEAVARALASELGADLERIECKAYRPGLRGFFRAGFASRWNRIPEISPRLLDPAAYDLVVIGGPVWAWNISTPIRAYLKREAPNLKRIAFFATAGGVGFAPALATMETLAGTKPLATLALPGEAFRKARDRPAIADFARSLRTLAPFPPDTAPPDTAPPDSGRPDAA